MSKIINNNGNKSLKRWFWAAALLVVFGWFFRLDNRETTRVPVQPLAQGRAQRVQLHAEQAQDQIETSKAASALEQPSLSTAAEVPVGLENDFPVYGYDWGQEEIPELRAFSRWADQFLKSPPHHSAHATEMEQGVALALARREIMETLIQMDPEWALASTVPRDVLMRLPETVRAHLERRVAGVGTLQVIGVSPELHGKRPLRLVERHADFGQEKYRAHVYGQMREMGYTEQVYLHGMALGTRIALADTPLRPMEVGEPLDPAVPVIATHPVSRAPANQTRDAGAGPFFVEGKEGYSCLCCSDLAWADNSAALTRAAGGAGPIVAAALSRAYNHTGAKRWLLIPVAFPDNTQSPWSSTTVRDSRITQTQDFFNTSSYGVFTLPTADAAPLQTMDNNSTYYVTEGYQTLKTHALDKASTAGYSSGDYDFVSVVINHNLYSSWAGRGQVGDKINWIDGYGSGSEQDQWTGVYLHEIGHNLGLWHSNSWISNTSIADDSNGTHDEYGHPFDVMGDAWSYTYDQLHFNASFKNALDWLSDSNITTLSDGDADASVNIYAMDQTQVSGRKYAVKLDTGISLEGITDLNYWIEFRTRYPSNTTLDDGVLIYTSNDSHTDEALKLLDMTPATSSFSDAGLDGGSSFTIAGGRWKITVNSQSGSGADSFVNVSFDDVRSPSITAQPADTSAKYGTSVTLTVSATGPSLSYQWYLDGTALSGETNSTLTLSDFQESNLGNYHVVVSNSYGSDTSNTAALTQDTGGGGGGCGSMPPINIVLFGWLSILFSRICLWLNFGVRCLGGAPDHSATPRKLHRNRRSLWFATFVSGLLLLNAGCTSLEARAKGVAKPFPGIRYLKDSQHSVYGHNGFLNSSPKPPEEPLSGNCFWDEAAEVWLFSGVLFMNEESAQALCLIAYWPVDFAATLGLDVALWPFDALDHYAHGRNGASADPDPDIIE